MASQTQADDGRNDSKLTADETVVVDQLPHRKIAISVGADSVSVTKTNLSQERTGPQEFETVTESETVEMDISERAVNSYTDIEVESESFDSTAASKSDKQKLVLVEVTDDGNLTAHHPLRHKNTQALYDDSVWGAELTSLNGVKRTSSGRSDTHRSHSTTKVRVEREAADAVEDRGNRLLAIKWREASGASRGNSSWSKFQPVEAIELTGE